MNRSHFRHAGIAVLALACIAAQATANDLQARVDALFARYDSTSSPGCSMAVSKDGAIVYERGYGMANREHGVPNRPDTVFHIASVSKQFTAAAIALLALDKKLSLDDPIHKHLPQLPRFDATITVDHLVHHTSGLQDFSDVMELSGWRYYWDLVTNEDAMNVLEKRRA